MQAMPGKYAPPAANCCWLVISTALQWVVSGSGHWTLTAVAR
jgi:hypothetical protein